MATLEKPITLNFPTTPTAPPTETFFSSSLKELENMFPKTPTHNVKSAFDPDDDDSDGDGTDLRPEDEKFMPPKIRQVERAVLRGAMKQAEKTTDFYLSKVVHNLDERSDNTCVYRKRTGNRCSEDKKKGKVYCSYHYSQLKRSKKVKQEKEKKLTGLRNTEEILNKRLIELGQPVPKMESEKNTEKRVERKREMVMEVLTDLATTNKSRKTENTSIPDSPIIDLTDKDPRLIESYNAQLPPPPPVVPPIDIISPIIQQVTEQMTKQFQQQMNLMLQQLKQVPSSSSHSRSSSTSSSSRSFSNPSLSSEEEVEVDSNSPTNPEFMDTSDNPFNDGIPNIVQVNHDEDKDLANALLDQTPTKTR